MNNYFAKLALIILILSIFPTTVLSQAKPAPVPLFLWGNVKWVTGFPAIGLEVRLIRNDTSAIVQTAYTNPSGGYAFFGSLGRPPDYRLKVYTGKTMRGEIRVPNLPIGGQAPDILIN